MANIPFLNNAYFTAKVGIGTASPSYPLDVVGDGIRLTRNSKTFIFNADFASAGTHANIQSDAGMGLSFSTNASEKMRITAAGNVGIGTTSPVSPLTVKSNSVSSGESGIVIQANGNTNSIIKLGERATDGGRFEMLDANVTKIALYTDGTSNYINAGNVGIGTTSPSTKLDVNGIATAKGFRTVSGSTDYSLLTRNSTNTAAYIQQAGSGPIVDFRYGSQAAGQGTSAMLIKSDGNVGIGTTSASQKLHVVGNSLVTGTQFIGDTFTKIQQASGNLLLTNQSSSGAIRFLTNNTERVRVTSAGNVGIGTTTPDGVLHIKKDNAPAAFEIQGGLNTQTTAGAINGEINFGVNDPSTTGGIGASIKNISEISNGAHNGLAFFTGLQSRTPYLQQMLYFTAQGGLSFGTTNNSYGTSGQILKSNADAPPSWVDASTVIGGPYLPLAGGTMTGDLKLNDNVDLYLGTGNDFQAYHDGSNTYLRNLNGSFIIKQDRVDEDLIFESDNGSGGTTEYFRLDGGSTMNVFSKPTWYGDGVKALFGNSSDLQIYHNGSNSYIQDAGAGSLKILAQDFDLNNAAETASMIRAIDGAQVELYYGGSKKLETTSTGITVTGNVNSSTISIDDYITHNGDPDTYFGFPTNNEFKLVAGGSNKFAADANAAYMYYQGGAKFQTSNTGVTVTGAATATTFLGDLNGTINTATTAVTKANATNDTTVATTAFVQNLIGTIPAGLVFQGTWNAATNTPTLTSGSGTTGHFYIVSTDGSTNLDGITDWKVGDWAVFVEQGASDQWEKVDNSSVLDGSGTGQKVTKWNGSGTSNTLTDGPITFSGNNSTFAGNVTAARGFFNSGTTNVVATFTSTDGIAGIALVDNGGNVELSASGNTFQVQPAGGVAQLTVGASSSTFAGDINFGDSHFIGDDADDNLLIQSSANENIIIDSAKDLILDAGGNDIRFKVNSVEYGKFKNDSNDFAIFSSIQDKDILFKGNDGGSTITALALDMSAGGNATFAGDITVGDDVFLADSGVINLGTDNDLVLFHDGADAVIRNNTGHVFFDNFASDRDIYFRGSDAGSTITALTLDMSEGGNATFSGDLTIPQYLKHTNDADTYFGFSASNQVLFHVGGSDRLIITSGGNVGIGTTSPVYKLDVNGGVQAGGKVTYTKSAGSLNTTGYAVAGITALPAGNGSSCGFTFTCFGGSGKYQKLVYSCYNSAGTWNAKKVIDEGTNDLNVVASANGSTITFTFKARSSTQSFTPRVTVEAVGTSINSTYA